MINTLFQLMDAASHLVIHNPHVNACERNFIQCLGMLIQILLIMYLAMYFIFVLSPQNFTATNYAEE
uniref:Very-long-chain 3-oxoacyl-CoA synthase n=1 Tax=Parastrongyloides trichosuri TaxID=131310 RepID=A0A0N4ZBG5_PARTI